MKCAACKVQVKDWNGSDPKCAFPNRVFTPDNWSCATAGLIRDLVYEGNPERYGISYQYCEDQKYATVKVDEIEFPRGRALALWVSWYKSRGGTEAMWLLSEDRAPRPPTEEDVLLILEAYGCLPIPFTVTDAGREALK